MFVTALHHDLLRQLGLASMEEVKAFRGELVKDHKGSREILRIRTHDAEGRELVLYFKRNWRPHQKDGLATLLRHGRPWSVSRQEWENSSALIQAGFNTAPLVSYGEETGLLWEKFSFLLTQSAGSQTVEMFLRACPDRARRRRVFDALTVEIRRFHEAGFATPDLFTRHLFVEADAEPPRFRWIDMARLDRAQPMPLRLRARDLAALNVTAPLRFLSTRERLRFLRLYAGGRDRALFRAIARRMKHLLGQKRHQGFLHDPAAPLYVGA